MKKECTLDDNTNNTQMKSASKSGNKSEDTSNIQTESESKLELVELQDSQASDSKMDSVSRTINDTRDRHTKSASKSGAESKDTSDIQTESESELESIESQDSQASDNDRRHT